MNATSFKGLVDERSVVVKAKLKALTKGLVVQLSRDVLAKFGIFNLQSHDFNEFRAAFARATSHVNAT